MDNWDPALLNQLARERHVILFDSLGIGESVGESPTSVEGWANFAAKMVRALDLETTDVLGWSLGGEVAQVLAIKYPTLVQRMILAATMPPGGTPEVSFSSKWLEQASAPRPSNENIMSLFYTDSKASRAAGSASFSRMANPPAAYASQTAMAAQAKAIEGYGANDGGWYTRLKEIAKPTLVSNGDRDGLFPAIDSAVLAREIPGSWLSIYPDSGHGFLFQYADRFSEDVVRFLKYWE
jgi:pimeloyl-ACP methyl ester carboxylesterase